MYVNYAFLYFNIILCYIIYNASCCMYVFDFIIYLFFKRTVICNLCVAFYPVTYRWNCSFINGESYIAVCSDTVWLGCLKGVCSFRWYFQTKVCSSGPCHLDPADPQTGQGGCHSHGPDCLSLCQCANLQPVTPHPVLPCQPATQGCEDANSMLRWRQISISLS